MDPISATASVLALLTAATDSCKFLSKNIRTIYNAPVDIQAQCDIIEAMLATLTRISVLWKDLPPPIAVSSELSQKLTSFVEEIEDVKISMKQLSKSLTRGSVHGAIVRIKWTAFGTDRLSRFMKRTIHWNSIFSNEIQAIQIAMLQNLIKTMSSPIDSQTALEIPNLVDTANVGQSPLPFAVENFVEPIGVQSLQSWDFAMNLLSFRFHCGPVVLRRLLSRRRQSYEVQLLSRGFEICVSFDFLFVPRLRITLSTFIFRRASTFDDIRASANLKISAIVPDEWPSFVAARNGDIPGLQRLLSSGQARLSDVTRRGDSLLHVAARNQNSEVISMLLSINADVNATNNRGMTPLHVAVTSVRNSTVPKLLLNGGADINRWDLNKKTPLHHFFDETIHEILLDSEIDSGIDCKDDRGMTIVHYVAWSSRSTRGDLSRALLKGCVSLTERDDTNRSALHLASQRGNLDIMAFLLASDHGAELASCDAHGRTPLHYATESHRAGTAIDMLLEYGLQIHHRDGNGCTVLHHAAARGKTEAVKKLLQVGAETDLHVCDQEGRTPMQIAAAWGAVPTTEYLRPIYLNAARGVLSVPPDNERKGPANVRQTSTYLYGQLFSCLVLLISMLVWIVGYG